MSVLQGHQCPCRPLFGVILGSFKTIPFGGAGACFQAPGLNRAFLDFPSFTVRQFSLRQAHCAYRFPSCTEVQHGDPPKNKHGTWQGPLEDDLPLTGSPLFVVPRSFLEANLRQTPDFSALREEWRSVSESAKDFAPRRKLKLLHRGFRNAAGGVQRRSTRVVSKWGGGGGSFFFGVSSVSLKKSITKHRQ